MKQFFLMIFAFLFGNIAQAQTDSTGKFTSQNNGDFARTIADTSTQLVDVRTPGEYSSGHIPGAVNMDVNASDFDKRTATLDKEKTVAVYCRSGARSKTAARRLAAKGFKVYELNKGIMGWKGKVE